MKNSAAAPAMVTRRGSHTKPFTTKLALEYGCIYGHGYTRAESEANARERYDNLMASRGRPLIEFLPDES